ncbi:MAG: hypothetical protein ACYC96_01135 [Fimbriimonadaceae bacterium]
MICFAIALISLAAPPQADTPNGGQIISKMLAHYSGLTTLTGNIRLVVQAKAPTGSVAEEVDTTVQYQQPNKLYIRQDRSPPHAKTWLVTSDGSHFSYNFPEGSGRHALSDRLVETVNALDVTQIYAAASLSVGDRSAPLGIAICWKDELRRIVANWPTHDFSGEVEYNQVKAWKVVGKFTEVPGGTVAGDYYLIISKQGDLLEYATRKEFATPTSPTRRDVEHPTVLTQTWHVALVPNGKPVPSLFTVVLRG